MERAKINDQIRNAGLGAGIQALKDSVGKKSRFSVIGGHLLQPPIPSNHSVLGDKQHKQSSTITMGLLIVCIFL